MEDVLGGGGCSGGKGGEQQRGGLQAAWRLCSCEYALSGHLEQPRKTAGRCASVACMCPLSAGQVLFVLQNLAVTAGIPQPCGPRPRGDGGGGQLLPPAPGGTRCGAQPSRMLKLLQPSAEQPATLTSLAAVRTTYYNMPTLAPAARQVRRLQIGMGQVLVGWGCEERREGRASCTEQNWRRE